MKRRAFLLFGVAAAVGAKAALANSTVEVYKTATCGCCGKWVEHLRSNGFTVSEHNVADIEAVRIRTGAPASLASCHIALVDGYVVQGHVPAADLRRLVTERPKALGLAVPGMPPGSPGMESNYAAAYDVLLFQSDGTSRVYHAYR